MFHPFELNEIEDFSDLDPDQNYYNPLMNQRISDCKYFNINQVNAEYHNKEPNQLSIFCMNIRSLRIFFTGLKTLLNIIDPKFHILALTETWLQQYNTDQFNIDGYSHVTQIRDGKEGEGFPYTLTIILTTKLERTSTPTAMIVTFFGWKSIKGTLTQIQIS